MKSLLTICLLATISSTALADKLAIVGGKVFTGSEQGTLESATVLINGNEIVSVSASSEVPEGYQSIDASGKYVTPGLIGAYTQLGLVEVSSSAGTVDASVSSNPVSSTGAAYDVSYAINPDSSLLAISRVEGFTSAVSGISRSDSLFHGLGAVITLSGTGDPVLKSRAFTAVNVGNGGADSNGGSRAALWVMLEEAISEAMQVSTAAQLSPSSQWHGLNSRADVKALKPVVNGETPLLMFADRAADIRQVIAFKQRYPKIKVVLVKGMEAWRVAEELADADIPVIIDPEFNLPGSFEQLGATLANAKRLEAAGVMVAIGMETHNIRLATQHAGNAVAFGMSWEGAMAALTVNPARIFGAPDKLGTLSSGAKADVVVWSGDPLEVTQAPEVVIIDGEMVEMTSRQIKLRDRYQQRAESGQTSQYIR